MYKENNSGVIADKTVQNNNCLNNQYEESILLRHVNHVNLNFENRCETIVSSDTDSSEQSNNGRFNLLIALQTVVNNSCRERIQLMY